MSRRILGLGNTEGRKIESLVEKAIESKCLLFLHVAYIIIHILLMSISISVSTFHPL
jgi:hypothetical protein